MKPALENPTTDRSEYPTVEVASLAIKESNKKLTSRKSVSEFTAMVYPTKDRKNI